MWGKPSLLFGYKSISDSSGDKFLESVFYIGGKCEMSKFSNI